MAAKLYLLFHWKERKRGRHQQHDQNFSMLNIWTVSMFSDPPCHCWDASDGPKQADKEATISWLCFRMHVVVPVAVQYPAMLGLKSVAAAPGTVGTVWEQDSSQEQRARWAAQIGRPLLTLHGGLLECPEICQFLQNKPAKSLWDFSCPHSSPRPQTPFTGLLPLWEKYLMRTLSLCPVSQSKE